MKYLLFLLITASAWAQCPLSVTTSTGSVCLVGQKGDKGDPGIQGPQGPPGPSGAAAPTSNLPITLQPDGSVLIKANVVITGAVTTGSGTAAPTVISITRTDGTTCSITFTPTNSMLWKCP